MVAMGQLRRREDVSNGLREKLLDSSTYADHIRGRDAMKEQNFEIESDRLVPAFDQLKANGPERLAVAFATGSPKHDTDDKE